MCNSPAQMHQLGSLTIEYGSEFVCHLLSSSPSYVHLDINFDSICTCSKMPLSPISKKRKVSAKHLLIAMRTSMHVKDLIHATILGSLGSYHGLLPSRNNYCLNIFDHQKCPLHPSWLPKSSQSSKSLASPIAIALQDTCN